MTKIGTISNESVSEDLATAERVAADALAAAEELRELTRRGEPLPPGSSLFDADNIAESAALRVDGLRAALEAEDVAKRSAIVREVADSVVAQLLSLEDTSGEAAEMLTAVMISYVDTVTSRQKAIREAHARLREVVEKYGSEYLPDGVQQGGRNSKYGAAYVSINGVLFMVEQVRNQASRALAAAVHESGIERV